MIAVIKGDIIHSRKVQDPELWLVPLKALLNQWGKTPQDWEIIWGDSFQLILKQPMEAVEKAIWIKSLIKSLRIDNKNRSKGMLDVRMAIGIGEERYAALRVSESDGKAFIFAGEKFENLKKEKNTLAIKTISDEFDDEMNLYLKLTNNIMNNWSISSAELAKITLQFPKITQHEIGNILKIKQNSVSSRYKRAQIEEILLVGNMYRKKITKLLI